MTELAAVIRYYGVSLALALAFYPALSDRLRFFSDQGWAFLRVASVLGLTWLTWMFSSLHLVPFAGVSVQVLFIAFVLAGMGLGVYQKKIPFQLGKGVLASEIVFALIFFIWSYLRGFAPDNIGLEKFMDFGFVQSIIRTEYAPPIDPWLAQEPINYYYLGHWTAALLIRLAGVPTELGYNLQMSWLFAMGAQLVWMLANTVAKTRFLGGILAVSFVFIFGNAHAFLFWPQVGDTYWYPAGTRYIYNTIHEYPLYSFVVNDLHGHVCDIPNTIFFLTIWAWIIIDGLKWWKVLLLTFSIGIAFATNAWNFAINLIVSGMFIWLRAAGYQFRALFQPRVVSETLQWSVALIFSSLAWVLPFWFSLKPPSKGVMPVTLDMTTPIHELAIVWGTQWPLVLFWGVCTFGFSKWVKPFLVDEKSKDAPTTEVFLKALAMGAFLLILIPELIYVKDIYPAHPRANTMFKLYYQAWIFLGLLVSIFVSRILTDPKLALPAHRFRYKILWVLLFLAIASGLTSTVRTYDQGLALRGQRRTLDGMEFLHRQSADDWDAVIALREIIQGQPTIVEGVGESYTNYSRISVFVGVPAILGWPVHEWLWRGSIDQEIEPRSSVSRQFGDGDTIQKRQQHVQAIYEDPDPEKTRLLLKRYNARYIVVGSLERSKYPLLKEDKLKALSSRIVFEKGTTRVYGF